MPSFQNRKKAIIYSMLTLGALVLEYKVPLQGVECKRLKFNTDHILGPCTTCYTSNNQRLGSTGDNDQTSKRFCSIPVLCVSSTSQIVKTHVITLRGVEGRDARDQISFCAFHSFIVEVQTNAGYVHATHA